MRTPHIRTISEFTEQEIVPPDGPRAGRPLRLDLAPGPRLLYQEIESGRWQRIFGTGPNQDGKSLFLFIIPILYLLFERRETVVLGVPSLDIAADKWAVNLLPAIKASRYHNLLPATGSGSRGGKVISVEFRHGPVLRFMTAGGDDQSRASFTTPNVVVTETEGFDEVGGSSREGDKLSQLERRLLAFGDEARLIAECTVGLDTGRTWKEFTNGTHSRIALPCPHCAAWVTPEREHFTGWQDAESDLDAVANAHLACPACGAAWTNEERIHANKSAVLVHKGQDIAPDGTVIGDPPRTNTLGMRWTVVNSVLNPERLPMVGGEEWRAKRANDTEAAERDLCQKQWVLPASPSKADVTQLDARVIMRRTLPRPRGVCPDDTQAITIGCDVGKRLHHWVITAWRPNATPHTLDYGRLEVQSDMMAEEEAITLALNDWRDELLEHGVWTVGDRELRPTFVFVDAGNWRETILQFAAASGPPFFATVGVGFGQRREGGTRRESGSKVLWEKDGYLLVEREDGLQYLEIKVDQWKGWCHARLSTPVGMPGGFTLFDSQDHFSYCKHLLAEKQVEEFSPTHGTVRKFVATSRVNHFLDATMQSHVAGYEAGMRLIEPPPPPLPPPAPLVIATPSTGWVPETSGWLNR